MAHKNKYNNYKYLISNYIKENKNLFIVVAIFCAIGVAIGMLVFFSGNSFLTILTSKHQNLISYITGSAKLSKLFWSNLFLGLICITFLFVFTLHYNMRFLAYAYLSYQSGVFILASLTIISYYKIYGILNFIFLMLPINIIMLAIYIFILSIFINRAKQQFKYKQQFMNTFNQGFFIKVGIAIAALVIVNITANYIIPLIIRGVYIINY